MKEVAGSPPLAIASSYAVLLVHPSYLPFARLDLLPKVGHDVAALITVEGIRP